MDLVVVFLKDVKEHKIVPESYVHDLCVSALKNRGNNACQNRLIFWSDECIEGLRYPNPNKNAKKSDTFPTDPLVGLGILDVHCFLQVIINCF